jgi:uncharacterized protein (TIGR03790 family)
MGDAAGPRQRNVRLIQRGLLIGWLLAGGLFRPDPAGAQTADNVLVVINTASPASVAVGEYYIKARHVSDSHVVRLSTTTAEVIERTEYQGTIETPIATWLARHSLQDRVLYLVLTKGIPLRINGTQGRDGTASSVDSELTLLYRKMIGIQTQVVGRVANPYFAKDTPPSEAKPFTRFIADIYLVTRLDGYTAADAMKLVDRALAPDQNGTIVLDERGSSDKSIGDRWLEETATRLQGTPAARVLLEMTPVPAATSDPVLGYYSSGSNDPSIRFRRLGLRFTNGALAGMFVSTDGRTFVEPPADWVPGTSRSTGADSLAGDLIREGVTGLVANVAEPYFDATARPQVIFPAYLSGFNLAESFYMSIPFLGWQTIVIGDPLCVPFPRKTLSTNEIDNGMDLTTELPALFAERRLALISESGPKVDGLKVDGLKLLLMADARLARDEATNVEPLLRRAVEIDPRLTVAYVRLASAYEQRREYDQAIEMYRRVVDIEPQNALALNNLAYALAEHQKKPHEALPLAEKAYALAPLPAIADTLGWIHHLRGDDESARPWIEKAIAGAPDGVDILIHAATVYAGLQNLAKARETLQAAEKLDPTIGGRSDVKALRVRLKDSETPLPADAPGF